MVSKGKPGRKCTSIKSHSSWSRKARNVARHREKKRSRLIELKGGQCAVCGYSKCREALEFHHVNPAEKSFNLTKVSLTKSWDTCVKEARKCLLLCANCHREMHVLERMTNGSQDDC